MDNARWQQVKAVLYEAMDQPAAACAAFLEEACGDDAELRAEVDRLLKAHRQAEQFLDTPPSLGDELAVALERNADAPDQVGPYRVVKRLGQGGMGDVFLAERADGLYQRRVALKIARRLYDPGLLRRFEAERRILASLEHPHIARLLGGGTTDDGRPYFTMAYVDGEPLTTYAATRELSLRQRLGLLAAVGETVHYAHRNLIVHRDLKPSNILIIEDDQERPQVRLLDFGIAKLLEASADGLTQTGGRPMTRAYAAPEQIRGEAVTTATDIYALGVILYELLTGRRPFLEDAPFELEQAILHTEPDAPSAAVRGAGSTTATGDSTTTGEPWARQIQGDLDVLCLKALHKDPGQRYASAEALVADVRRYLKGQPIEARPPTRGYRLRKFMQRHRGGVAAAAAVFVLVVAFAVAMAVQSARLADERDRATLALERAEEVTDFMLGLFDASNPNEEQDKLTAVQLLDRGIGQAQDLADQPEVQAQMLATVGQAYLSLGQFPAADSLITQALAIRRELHGPVHADIASSLRTLALLRTEAEGDYGAAQALLEEALAIYDQLDGAFTEDRADVNLSLGALLFYQSEFAEAERVFRTVLALPRPQAPTPDEETQYTGILNNLALALIRQEKYEEAEAYLHEAVTINRRVLGDEHPSVATNLNLLGTSFWYRGAHREAEEIFVEVLARRQKLYGDDHPAVAAIHNNLGSVYQSLGDLEAAEQHGRQALAIQRQSQGPQHPLLAQGLENLGRTLVEATKYEAAEAAFLEALAIYRARFGDQHIKIGTVRRNLYELYLAWDQPDRAAAYAPRSTADEVG